MNTKRSALAVLAICLLGGAAHAATGPAFESFDEDSNGLLTVNEVQKDPHLTAMFEEADVNKDGMLSRAEYEAIISGAPMQN